MGAFRFEHESLFGSKRVILIETFGCSSYNKFIQEVSNKKIVEAISEVAEKINKERESKANWVVLSGYKRGLVSMNEKPLEDEDFSITGETENKN